MSQKKNDWAEAAVEIAFFAFLVIMVLISKGML